MKIFLYILMMLVVGALTPFQATMNARIGTLLQHPFYATLTNFVVGLAAVLVLLLLLRPEIPSLRQVASLPPYLYLGGLIGVMLVTSLVIAIPRIGATNALMALLVGQMLLAVLIDHNGWMGVPENAISLSRIIGAGFLLTGLYLVQRTG
ncbi:MAG: DMT family transporter [Gammaproteobacteria bacterium]